MIGMKVKIEDTMNRVEDAAEKAAYRNFGHAAASIAKDAKSTIRRAPKAVGKSSQAGTKRDSKGRFVKGSGKKKRTRGAQVSSPPGTPPYTRRGQLKRAIKYAANKDGAVIGPEFSKVGVSAEAHEFGKQYKGADYPDRPFMGPALQRNINRFAQSWAGSIGS